jgi:alkanesulfonate monooxygenase SsuD/methylene tetrahydromethanopterin reductase-like flavin-dependent oxidoreductase (luciferase family)
MHIGIISNCSDRSLDAGTQARLAEEAGFESITFGEHSHIPAARETPYPGNSDGMLPSGYERTLDLFVVLTADEGEFAAELERARATHAEFAGTA